MELLIDENDKCTAIDAHRLMSRLWQGSAPRSGRTLYALGFDVLVLCAEELQTQDQFSEAGINPPPSLNEVGVYLCPLDDFKLSAREAGLATKAAIELAALHRRGKRLLVTCAQGRNRSGLVSALTIRLLTGCTGRTAADHVRVVRPNSLTNPWFRAYLDDLPAPTAASIAGQGRVHPVVANVRA